MRSRLVFCLWVFALSSALLRADDTPAKHQPPPLPPQAKELSINEIEIYLRDHKDVSVLDVRSAEEVNEEGRIAGAKHRDYFSSDFDKVLTDLSIDATKPCIVYCEYGGRARRAAEKLAKLGCREILLPAGGFNAWRKAGKPVEGGAAPKPQP